MVRQVSQFLRIETNTVPVSDLIVFSKAGFLAVSADSEDILDLEFLVVTLSGLEVVVDDLEFILRWVYRLQCSIEQLVVRIDRMRNAAF